MASNTPTVARRFTRDAYDRYELLKEKLLGAGSAEIDILLRLDRITRQAADLEASEGMPKPARALRRLFNQDALRSKLRWRLRASLRPEAGGLGGR